MTGFQSKRASAQDKLKGQGMKAYVTTTIVQEIEVPEDATKQDVLNFLAENQSFRDAFEGVSDAEQQYRITDIEVLMDEIKQLGEEAYDE
jgi:hypothetical protein